MDVTSARSLAAHACWLWKEYKLLDVAITCQKKTFYAHRVVVTAFSSTLMECLEKTTHTSCIAEEIIKVIRVTMLIYFVVRCEYSLYY